MCDKTYSYVWHDSLIFYLWHDACRCVTRLIHMRDTFVIQYVTWLMQMRDITHSYVWHDSFICATWLTHICDVTHADAWHASFIRETRVFSNMCDMTDSYLRHDSFNMCDMTHSYVWHKSVWHASFIRVTCVFSNMCDMTHLYVCDMTHSYVWHDSFNMCDMTASYLWHISFNMCDLTHSYVWHKSVWHASFIRVTRVLSNICDMTHSICVTWLIHTCDTNLCDTSLIVMRDVGLMVICDFFLQIRDMTYFFPDTWHDSLLRHLICT